MHDTTTMVESTPVSFIKRVSWPAIFAGVFVAIAIQLLLSLLGLGIGASTIDPLRESHPMSGIGTGSAIWFAISIIVALFFGGWVAGRMSGIQQRVEVMLQGILTWSFTSILLFYLVNSVMGGLISGAVGIVGRGVSAVGQSIATVAPQVADFASNKLGQADFGQIKNDINLMLKQTGKPELQPENLQNNAQQAANDAGNTAVQTQQNPATADSDLNGLVDRLLFQGQTTLAAADKEALVNVIVARTNLSRDQAAQKVDQWQATAQLAQQKFVQAQAAAEQKARQVGDAAAKNISRAALLSTLALVLGAVASAVGALAGIPRNTLVTEERPRNFNIPVQRPVL